LLAEAGLKDEDGDGWLDRADKRLELGLRLNGENSLHQDLGWLVSSYYRDLGLFARAESVAFDNLVDDLFTHDFELALFSWPLLPDPDQHLYWRSTENEEGVGLNFTSYDNPRLDKLLDQAVAVPGCDTPTRAKIYGDIQEILAQERPLDFLLTPNYHLLVTQRLQGVNPGPFAPLAWNVTNWYLKEE
jgi:peptide/nickel transport system substrate-binding protein